MMPKVPPAELTGADACEICATSAFAGPFPYGHSCHFPQCAEGDSNSSRHCVWGAFNPAASSSLAWVSSGDAMCGTGEAPNNPDGRCPVVTAYGVGVETQNCHQGFVRGLLSCRPFLSGPRAVVMSIVFLLGRVVAAVRPMSQRA